jgi:hypothetical protein
VPAQVRGDVDHAADVLGGDMLAGLVEMVRHLQVPADRRTESP